MWVERFGNAVSQQQASVTNITLGSMPGLGRQTRSFVGWQARTHRISGARVQPTRPNANDDTTWNKLGCHVGVGRLPQSVSELALFSGSSVVGAMANEEGVELGPLRCYKKAPIHTSLGGKQKVDAVAAVVVVVVVLFFKLG